MNFQEQFVALTALTVKADREISQCEIDTIIMLAEGLKLNVDEVKKSIQSNLYQNSSVESIARTVATEDKLVMLESCIIVALADNKLQVKEVEFLTKLNNALGLPQTAFVLSIASVCQNNRQIKIEGNDSDFDKDEVVIED